MQLLQNIPMAAPRPHGQFLPDANSGIARKVGKFTYELNYFYLISWCCLHIQIGVDKVKKCMEINVSLLKCLKLSQV